MMFIISEKNLKKKKKKKSSEKAGAPGTPEIVDYDQESVDLKWTPPKSDGGAKIEKYIIEKKDRYQPNDCHDPKIQLD